MKKNGRERIRVCEGNLYRLCSGEPRGLTHCSEFGVSVVALVYMLLNIVMNCVHVSSS